MDYSHALERLKDGEALTRRAWITEAVLEATPDAVILLKAIRYAADRRQPFEYGVPFVVVMTALSLPPFNTQGTARKVNDRTAGWIGEDKSLESGPYFAHYDPATNEWQPGWLPNVKDIFADDWITL